MQKLELLLVIQRTRLRAVLFNYTSAGNYKQKHPHPDASASIHMRLVAAMFCWM